jgi:2-polyprenyl-3-methyl-5-hydroxy-6-metoxy-1,4-benzoquinol methylase
MERKVGMIGQVPALLIRKVENPEKHKYEKLWKDPAYRRVAPGEHLAQVFLEKVAPPPNEHVIDFGAGTGRGAIMLALIGRLRVTMLDFVPHCLDEEVANATRTQPERISFIQHDLTEPAPVSARYGYCTDVMEHIPEDKVPQVLTNILKAAQHVFFNISTVPDHFGQTIGEHLHVTVKPAEWWIEQLRKLDVFVHWSHSSGHDVSLYVTAWSDARRIVERGALNTGRDEMVRNIRENVHRGYVEAKPHQRQKARLLMLGGGPSLADSWDEIREKREAGAKLVTINGTYNECLARGLRPSAQVVCDAREFNKRFLEPVIPDCRYMLASQCHPSMFEGIPPEQVLLWHAVVSNDLGDILDEEYSKDDRVWYPVPGGSTAMLRAFPLFLMLGFNEFEVYGFDSCLGYGDVHHAYSQPENDGQSVVKVTCGNRVFRCHPWMVSQAQEFCDEVRLLGDEVRLVVHGDGLIAHIIKTGAEIEEEQQEG